MPAREVLVAVSFAGLRELRKRVRKSSIAIGLGLESGQERGQIVA